MCRLTDKQTGCLKDGVLIYEAIEKLAAIEDAFDAGCALICPTPESQKALSEIQEKG